MSVSLWKFYHAHREDIVPLLTIAGGGIGGGIIAWAALRQARTSTRQAQIAMLRHEEQTKADQQRRITESFSKAIEQLGHEKIEVRLGGIYGLERISRESPDDYWTVMETLTAFVRERARWIEDSLSGSERGADSNADRAAAATARPQAVPTDIAAVLSVVLRRDEKSRKREREDEWRLDLHGADLQGASLARAHLERALLWEAHLELAFLPGAHLEGAGLMGAHLEGAVLMSAHLEGAHLEKAYLEDAILLKAHLEGADLEGAHLERANINQAHIEGADLTGATGLSDEQLAQAYGDAKTRLPSGMCRPPHWPAAQK